MSNANHKIRLPTYFISHGGGPWPWLKDGMRGAYDKLEASLQELPREIGMTPRAILAVSGHWEARDFTVMSGATPPMLYDYIGFPAHTYSIKYAAPGSPQVARRVQELLTASGIGTREDSARGFDHGVFAPLAVAYPQANVPVVQLSIRSDYEPEAHLAVGRALAPLRDEGVLILASGLSYHNLRQFDARASVPSREFDEWLNAAVCGASGEERNRLLRDWQRAPSARAAHPRADHLIPLMVAVGAAAAEAGVRVYHEDAFLGGITVSSFRFGAAAVLPFAAPEVSVFSDHQVES
jgi:aromatic ring-opening dioxygenase catalytic subunit (LigB family)